MITYSKFEQFLKDNNLKKGEVATYLEIAPSNITDYCKGGRIPDAQMEKLIRNNRKWDVTALLTPTSAKDSMPKVTNADAMIQFLYGEVEMLRQMLNNQSAIIAGYEAMIKAFIESRNHGV